MAGNPLREVFERWRDGYGFNEDSGEDVALLDRAAAPAKQEDAPGGLQSEGR